MNGNQLWKEQVQEVIKENHGIRLQRKVPPFLDEVQHGIKEPGRLKEHLFPMAHVLTLHIPEEGTLHWQEDLYMRRTWERLPGRSTVSMAVPPFL